jgi:hypothetical protein
MSGNLGEIQENIGLDIPKKGRSCPKNLHGHYSGKPTSVEATKPSPERFFERFCERAKHKKKRSEIADPFLSVGSCTYFLKKIVQQKFNDVHLFSTTFSLPPLCGTK